MSEDHGLTVEEIPRGVLCLADGMEYRDHVWWPTTFECGRCGALYRDPPVDTPVPGVS